MGFNSGFKGLTETNEVYTAVMTCVELDKLPCYYHRLLNSVLL